MLDDATLAADEKRAILSSWASDLYVVESYPTLREVPGIPHRMRLNDILSAAKQLDNDPDPPPRGGMAMRLPRFADFECTVSEVPLPVFDRRAATRRLPMEVSRQRHQPRWTREANVRRYRKLLSTELTYLERSFIERRLAEELHDRSVPLTTMEGNDVCQL